MAARRNYFKGCPVICSDSFFPRKPIIMAKNYLHSSQKLHNQSRPELMTEKAAILANDQALNDRHSGIVVLNCVIET